MKSPAKNVFRHLLKSSSKAFLCFLALLSPFTELPSQESNEKTEANATKIELTKLGMVFRRISPMKLGSIGPDYFILETEVTNKMYQAHLMATGKVKDDEKSLALSIEQDESNSFSTNDPVYSIQNENLLWKGNTPPINKEKHPVVTISIHQADDFCKWLTEEHPELGAFRLPTKDEWLIAAYGVDRKFPWGDELDPQNWHHKVGAKKSETEPVKFRPAGCTPEGLFGMWGNAREYAVYRDELDDYKLNRNNPEYQFQNRTWMGGSYNDELGSKYHFKPKQDYWGYTHNSGGFSDDLGFRIVLEPPSKENTLVESLHMMKKEAKAENLHKVRFYHLPEPSRALLRAKTRRDDHQLEEYQTLINKYRSALDPDLLKQLVPLLGYDKPHDILTSGILEDLFTKTWLIKTTPEFFQNKAELKKTQSIVAEAFNYVSDKSAFDTLMHMFLEVFPVSEVKLTLDDLNLTIIRRINREVPTFVESEGGLSFGGGRYTDNEIGRVDNYKWTDIISDINISFQKWIVDHRKGTFDSSKPSDKPL